MGSRAASKFNLGLERATVLYDMVGKPALRPQSRRDAEAILHASLASSVAAWNFYLPNLVRDFREATSDPLDVRYNAIHTVLSQTAEISLSKFNTPNAENSRNLLVSLTGYDAINDWLWPQRGMSGVATRERLNEILKVRHSFAHGFSIPAYVWMQGPGGRVAIRKDAMEMTLAFFRNLVKRTDTGMANHLRNVYGVNFR